MGIMFRLTFNGFSGNRNDLRKLDCGASLERSKIQLSHKLECFRRSCIIFSGAQKKSQLLLKELDLMKRCFIILE